MILTSCKRAKGMPLHHGGFATAQILPASAKLGNKFEELGDGG